MKHRCIVSSWRNGNQWVEDTLRMENEVNYRGKVLEIKFGTKRYYQYSFEKFKSRLIDDFPNSLLVF